LRSAIGFAAVLVASVMPVGCIPPVPAPVVIELVNATGLDVTPGLFVDASATTAEALFVPDKRVTDFTDRPFPELRANETRSITIDCDQAAAIGVDATIQFDATSLTVTTSTDRIFSTRGDAYDCGSTVRFTYTLEGGVFRVRME